VAQSVQAQIDEATARLGRPGEAAAPPGAAAASDPVARQPAASQTQDDATWGGMPVRITAGEEARTKIPTGATLFVIVRSPGPAMGPPLGVRRVMDPILPLDITIGDQDSMLQERKISLEAEVQLQARISLSGSPSVASGDWQSMPVTVPLSATDTVELILDQQVE
jgi:hypothetical protein